MAAKAISDVESLYGWIGNIGKEETNRKHPEPTWETVAPALRAMIDDQAALKAAIDAIALLEGPSDLSTAVAAAVAAAAASVARIA